MYLSVFIQSKKCYYYTISCIIYNITITPYVKILLHTIELYLNKNIYYYC